MKRVQLFEFEDFDWLPNVIRGAITNLIVVFHKMMGTAEVISSLIQKLQEHQSFSQIVDLGSGSGGAMPEVLSKINEANSQNPLTLVLTDLFPDPRTVKEINDRQLEGVSYHEQSVDATNISQAPEGMKTMIASFHHMRPETAKKILTSAQDNNETILIFELAKNNIPLVVWWLLLPISLSILIIMCLVMTLFVRPLSFSQVLFTYLIPIIPIVYAWDGQASLVRTYTFEDINHLLEDIRNEDYEWSIGDAKKANGKNMGYYVMGHPKVDE